MSDRDRFLKFAALGLIRQEGVRLVKAEGGEPWIEGWDEWDEVLVGDGPGVRPAVFAFRAADSDDEASMRDLHEAVVARIAAGSRPSAGPPESTIRVVTVFCLNHIDPGLGRRLARAAPRQFYSHVKPEVWVVDLAHGHLYAPKNFGLVPSRAQAAVTDALREMAGGASEIGVADLAHAQAATRGQQDAFLTAIRKHVPYVTYAVLAACWIVFLLQGIYGGADIGGIRITSVPGGTLVTWATPQTVSGFNVYDGSTKLNTTLIKSGDHVYHFLASGVIHHLVLKSIQPVTLEGITAVPSNSTAVHFGAMEPSLVKNGQWWRLFTEMFVHFGLIHILFNSIALFSVGGVVERIYGHLKYALIYLISGLFASAASFVYFIAFGPSLTVAGGASGAIFGIAGVVIVLGVRRRSIVPRSIAVRLSTTMATLIAANLVFDFFDSTIDYRAHVGGLLAGLVLGYILVPKNPVASDEPALLAQA